MHSSLRITATLAICTVLTACAQEPDTPQHTERAVVDVIATHDHERDLHLFDISEREIPPGWTTFNFINASPVDHFFLIWHYPDEGIAAAEAAGEPLLDHWREGVAMSFEGFDSYLDGDITFEEFLESLVANVHQKAPWFLDPGAVPMGGPGMTAAGRSSATTVHLEPGEYIVECYVRDENGVFHTVAGMLDHMTVTGEGTGAQAPEPTARLTVSSDGGFRIDDALQAGSHVIEIHFEDQTTYDHLLGHNANLVKLRDKDDGGLLAKLAEWMDWRHPDGLVNRPPDGASFLGGVMEMAGGATAYFHVDLEPGDYAWIAEIPDPAAHGMLRTFRIGPLQTAD